MLHGFAGTAPDPPKTGGNRRNNEQHGHKAWEGASEIPNKLRSLHPNDFPIKLGRIIEVERSLTRFSVYNPVVFLPSVLIVQKSLALCIDTFPLQEAAISIFIYFYAMDIISIIDRYNRHFIPPNNHPIMQQAKRLMLPILDFEGFKIFIEGGSQHLSASRRLRKQSSFIE